jgi:hypothetical protein
MNLEADYGDVALGIECALPAGYDPRFREPRRRRRRTGKEGGRIVPAAAGRFGTRLRADAEAGLIAA